MKRNNRTPYMIVSHYTSPLPGTRTQVPGWARDGKVQVRERVEFDTRLKRQDMAKATVVIDIHAREVLKNRYQDSFTADVLIDHYFKKYNSQLAGFLAEFLAAEGAPEVAVTAVAAVADAPPADPDLKPAIPVAASPDKDQ